MSAAADLAAARRDLDTLLRATDDGASEPSAVADRVRALLRALPRTPWWIEVGAARRLLGIDSDATVAAWARLGLLASRLRPDGETEVLLADVLKRRIERDELIAVGGDEMTPEELRVLREERPGANPWQIQELEALAADVLACGEWNLYRLARAD